VPRQLALSGRIVDYSFSRRRRRTLGVTVDADGLAVAAPLRMPWREIEAFLRGKERWIVAKLDEWSRAPRPAVLHGESGETLPLFGKPVIVDVHEGARAVKWRQDQLMVHAPRSCVIDTLIQWLKARALEALKPRTGHYASRLDLPAPRIALSSARSQWGICGADGSIRLSPGTLYRSIQRMLEDGLIVETDERPSPEDDDERRRYYRLTTLGTAVAQAEAARLMDLVRMARARGLAPRKV